MAFDSLAGLTPAEAGLIVDHQAGIDEAYASFADLVVKGRVVFVGSPPNRVFSWDGKLDGLDAHEKFVLQTVFVEPKAGEEAASKRIGSIRPLQFAASVADGCREDGVYSFNAGEALYLNLAKYRLTWSAVLLGALFFLAPFLSFLLAGLAVVSVSLAGYGSGQALFVAFSLAVMLWVPIYLGAIAIAVLGLSKKGFISVGRDEPTLPYKVLLVILGAVFWWFFLALLVIAGAIIVFNLGVGVMTDLDSKLTPAGKKKKERYLELKEFLETHSLAQSRLANEYEPYRIAFGLARNCRKIPA
ncbi:hypothetical protein AUJ14_03540 [Candidatus Micrarchaeota archaeon CG1_02_55_22]|nr:MAG: hypothetical protein AUJ14_03540 [Candidatus Micrarchaeota archaeon CG1_02_55_22]